MCKHKHGFTLGRAGDYEMREPTLIILIGIVATLISNFGSSAGMAALADWEGTVANNGGIIIQDVERTRSPDCFWDGRTRPQ